MKKLLLSILIIILYINSNAQSPLRINKYLVDSLAGDGFWYIYHDSTHTGQWGVLGSGGGSSSGQRFSVIGEDDNATANRIMHMNGNEFEYDSLSHLSLYGINSINNFSFHGDNTDPGIGAYFRNIANTKQAGMDIYPGYASFYNEQGIVQINDFSNYVKIAYNNNSLWIRDDSTLFQPPLGKINIDSLRTGSSISANTLMGWVQGSNQGPVGYVTIGSGLSLSGGVLSSTGGSDTSYVYTNTLYNQGIVAFTDNFSRNSIGVNSDYDFTFPGTTETISTDGLRLVGNPDNYNNWIVRTFNTAAENFEYTVTFINNTISSSDTGIVIGVRSENGNCCQNDVYAGVNQATGDPDLGKSFIYSPAYATYLSTGTDAISSISVGDTIQIQLKRSGLTYIVNTTNITTGESSTDTADATLNLTPVPFFPNNTSRTIIFFKSGDVTVIGNEYRILDTWNCDYAFVGNSITQGQAASAYDLTFPNRTFENDSGITVITSAGGGDGTELVVSRLPELYKLKPRYVALMIGGNDIFFGIPAATWKAQYLTIRDSLVNHGISVIHLYPTPRNGTDMTPLVNYLDTCSVFANDAKVRATWDSLKTGGTGLKAVYDAGDGTHLNDSGHHYVALKIREVITPHLRTFLPTIPIMALIADGYDEHKKLFLSNTGWDSIPTGSSGGGGGDVFKVGTPADNQIGIWTGDGTIEGTNNLTWDGSTLSVVNGAIKITQTSFQFSTLVQADISSTIANSVLKVGDGSTIPTSFSSFGVAPAYAGATSPTTFYLSNFPNILAPGSTQFLIYQSASGDDIVMSSMAGFGSQAKKNYYFNTTQFNGSTNASLSLLSNGNTIVNYRLLQTQGADVASVAGAVALGTDGNTFEITGTNAITLISNVSWQNGSVITLAFTSTATLTDGTANSGTNIGMELAGNTNFVASAGATLTLRLIEIGGTQRWREIARSVN